MRAGELDKKRRSLAEVVLVVVLLWFVEAGCEVGRA